MRLGTDIDRIIIRFHKVTEFLKRILTVLNFGHVILFIFRAWLAIKFLFDKKYQPIIIIRTLPKSSWFF